ncbi:MAG: hypothetical protein RLZZ631_776 [Cyanobacteriota bacterium]|jgi:hypothetical protein
MPLPFQDKPGQLFDNADSFAMVFDAAWQQLISQPKASGMSAEEKKRTALEACADHPFRLSNPAMADQVADFRIRLLGL